MSALNWIPLDDKVIVEPDDAPDKVGNILLPDSAKKKPKQGRVLAVGPGRRNESLANDGRYPVAVKEGQRVLYGEWAGMEIDIGGKTLRVLSEGDICAVST